ncbi:MAG: phospholipase [Lentisphaeria bacterium]|nr:phospholipase [Lentisphaeria bacterium]
MENKNNCDNDLLKRCGVTQSQFKGSNGKVLNYCRKEAGDWSKVEKVPLVLFLHGAGERGDNNWSQLVHGASELTSYCQQKDIAALLLFPQCPANMQWVNTPWGEVEHSLPEISENLQLAMEMLDFECADSKIDLNRIYIVGISMGGYGTWDALSRFPEKFAAAFPICGGADIKMAERLKNIPILTYHGDSDTVVPTCRTRNIYAAIKAAGGEKITYVEVPDCGHESWVIAFAKRENWDWLFSQSK